MSAQPVISITTITGERFAVSEARHPSRSYGRMFHTTFDDAAGKIARTITQGLALRLFLILPEHLSYTLFRRLDQTKIAAELATEQGSISKALKTLQMAGVIDKKGSGAHIEWKLSPEFGWRGDVDSYHAEQRRRGRAAPAAPPPPTIDHRRIYISATQHGTQTADQTAPTNATASAPKGRPTTPSSIGRKMDHPWLEQIASELLDTASELQHLLRASRYDPAAPQHAKTRRGHAAPRTFTLSEMEARALLRGVLPAPIGASKLKSQHVRLNQATGQLTAQLFALNQPDRPTDHAIAAALTLADELATWITAARWKQATTKAGKSWPLPIIAIMRQSPDAKKEQTKNSNLPIFPTIASAATSHDRHASTGRPLIQALRRQSTKHLAEQNAFELAAATIDSGKIVPLRQPAQAIPTLQTKKAQANG